MANWLSDYWRDQEEKRKREADANGAKPLLGHEDFGNSGCGFDRDTFDLGKLRGQIERRRPS